MNNTSMFIKLLSGISKSLSIASRVIPIYQDAMPLFKNAKNIYSLIANKQNDKKDEIIKEKPITKKETTTIKKNDSSPQFFI